MTFARILPIAVVLALLAGCDGAAPGTPAPPPPPPAGNRAPVAQFAAPATVIAGQPLAFDGSASSDPDGDALSLHWDFGDGLRGGGGRLAHVFDSAGSYPVTLTATDPAGASGSLSHTITVAPAPGPARTQAVSGRVTALDGSALAEVGVRAGATTGVTDGDGRLSLALGIGVPQTLRFSRSGYVDQVQTLNFPEGSGEDTSFVVAMRAGEPAQTLADAAAGGVLSGRDGVRIQLPPAALVTAAGVPVSGAVDITMTPIDITLPNAGGFPGQFAGIDANAVVQPIVSYGTTDFVLSQGGQRLQLAPGKPAEILLPLYATQRLGGAVIAVGERLPLWSLSETSGLWVQEGEGEVVAAAAAPTGMALRATVSHFSPWNADIPFVLRSPGVRGRCVYDDDIGVPGARDHFATAVLCNWLAEMDRGIPPQGAARGAPAHAPARFGSQAEPPPPPLPGFSAYGAVPVGGDVLALPANAPIRFTVTALNGSFTGSATLAAGSTESEVVVKMRPLETGGGDGEAITLPFEAERRFEAGETQSFRLEGQGFRWLRVTVTPTGSGAPVQGELRVFRGLLPVAGGNLQAGLTVLLAANGEHRVELLPTGDTPTTARLRIELLGSDQAETLPLPLDLNRSQPELTVLRTSFNVEAARTLHFGLRENRVHYRLREPDGSEVFNFPADGNASSFSFLQRSLPASIGTYVLEAASIDGLTWPLNLSAELSHWLPQGAVLDGYKLLDLVADRAGQPVLLLSRDYSEGGSARQALVLRRWSGSEWLEAAGELTGIVPRNCGFSGANAASLAFDSSNRPLLAYTEALGSAGIRTVVQRYSGSAWQTLGPDQGVLGQNPGRASCTTARVLIRVDGDDRPLVALRSAQSDFQFEVRRYDGSAWTGIAAPLAASDPFDGEQFDLQLAPDGQAYVASSQRSTAEAARVLRYVAGPGPQSGPGAWQAVGPDQGRLPAPAGQGAEYDPLLRFTASGQPIVAGGNRQSVAVFRYDGSQWTAGAAAGIPVNGSLQPEVAFAMLGDEATLGWARVASVNGRFTNTPLVQASDAADRYRPFGADDGAVVPFSPGNRASGYVPDSGRQQRLLNIGGVLYQAIEASSMDGSTSRNRVSLLRLTP